MTERIRCAALLYHQVGPEREQACAGLNVSPARFKRQMATLAALGWNSISPQQWASHVSSGLPLPRNPFMITFDDAYADVHEFALPILTRHGFTATIFIATGFIGKKLGCNPRHHDAFMDIMSREQIREWSAAGMTCGAHSRGHTDLTAAEADAIESEIIGSCDDIEEVCGTRPVAFAYPYGRKNETAEQCVSRNSLIAFTTEEGMNDRLTPLTALRRTMVQHGDTVADVCLRVRYGASVLQNLRNLRW